MSIQPERNGAALNEVVEEVMAAAQVPGAVVGITLGDQTLTAAYGVTNVNHRLPVTTDTYFQIGSITKTFTGTAVLRLADQGRLDLDAPVREYLPNFRVADEHASAAVTVRHLLTHSPGWTGDFFHDTGSGDDALARYVEAMATLEQQAPLGQLYSYNNAGFVLLGRILEVVSGSSFAALLHDLVLEPLGLEQSTLDPTVVMTERFVVGHTRGQDGPAVARPWALPRYAQPGGGLICTVSDLLRYAAFHLAGSGSVNGSKLLAAERLAEMQHPQVQIGGQQDAVGLSWFITDFQGVSTLSHGGGTVGQGAYLLLAPEQELALAIMTNGQQGGRVIETVRDWTLAHYLNVDVPKPEPRDVDPAELEPLLGRYRRPMADIELDLDEEGRLIGQLQFNQGFPTEAERPRPAPPPFACALIGPEQLMVLEGPFSRAQGEFIRDSKGAVGWLRVSGRLHRRVAPDQDDRPIQEDNDA